MDGAWVRDARMARGIKLAHVASRLGVSSSYVSQLEAGLRPFSLKLWTRYRKALEG